MIQTVILAGGLGTRLKPLTLNVPKPMVPVHEKPFLEYIISWVTKFKIKRFLFLVGYLGEQIEEYFGDGKKWGVELQYSYEDSPMGTAGALKQAEPFLEERFLLLNGDTFLPIDYASFASDFIGSECEAFVAAYQGPGFSSLYNLSVSSVERRVTQYSKTTTLGMTHVDAGVYGFQKKILLEIPQGKLFSLENEILPKLAQKQVLKAHPVFERYYDIGTPERLEIFKKRILELEVQI